MLKFGLGFSAIIFKVGEVVDIRDTCWTRVIDTTQNDQQKREREREREKDEKALGHFTVSFQRPLLPFGHGRLSLVDHKRKENVGTRSNQQWKGVLRKRQKFNWPALFFLIFFFLSFFIFFIFFILALYWYFFNNYFSFFFANGGMLKVKVASMLPNVNKFVENSL